MPMEVRSCFVLFQWSKVIIVETISAETRFIFDSVIGSKVIFSTMPIEVRYVLNYVNGNKVMLWIVLLK